MAFVTTRDAAALLELVHEGALATGTELFPTVVLRGLDRLIPSDAFVGYQEVDVRRGGCRLIGRVELGGGQVSAGVEQATHRFCGQNPLRDPLRARDSRVLKLSDFFTRRQLSRNEFHLEVWRPLGVGDCLRLWLPAPTHTARVIFLERKRSYDERDRALLELLRPHLIRFRASADYRRRSTGACGLTEREAEVVGWIERGKTNREIAALLCVSPHTVRAHVENIFEKLGVHTRAAAVARLAREART